MANFNNPYPAGHSNGDELFAEHIDPVLEAMPMIPNFAGGSTHTPTDVVQVLGDQGMEIERLRNGTGFEANPLIVGAPLVPIVIPPCKFVPAEPANWYRYHNYMYRQDAPSGPQGASANIIVPSGTILQSVVAHISGGAHGTWPPANLPFAEVHKTSVATGTSVQIGSTTYYSGDQSTYENYASIDVSGITDDANRTTATSSEYFSILLASEGGANAVAGFTIHGVSVTVAPTRMAVP